MSGRKRVSHEVIERTYEYDDEPEEAEEADEGDLDDADDADDDEN